MKNKILAPVSIIMLLGACWGWVVKKLFFAYSDASLIHDDMKLNFQLSADKVEQFESFKNTINR